MRAAASRRGASVTLWAVAVAFATNMLPPQPRAIADPAISAANLPVGAIRRRAAPRHARC